MTNEAHARQHEETQAKLQFLEAFHNDLDNKVQFLREMYDEGHQDEAVAICCVYIDGIGKYLYWPEERSSFNFVRALREHGNQPHFDRVHAVVLIRWLSRAKGRRRRALGRKLDELFPSDRDRLYEENDFVQRVEQSLTSSELALLRQELWRGTLAWVAYNRMRKPFVHELRGYGAVVFDSTTLDGLAVPPIEFGSLHTALSAIAQHARQLSLSTGKWFGHVMARRNLQ